MAKPKAMTEITGTFRLMTDDMIVLAMSQSSDLVWIPLKGSVVAGEDHKRGNPVSVSIPEKLARLKGLLP